jgi:hypothetical protein
MMEEKETRKRNPPTKVWCLHSECAAIEANAKAAGLSLSTYLRRVGMGYEIGSQTSESGQKQRNGQVGGTLTNVRFDSIFHWRYLCVNRHHGPRRAESAVWASPCRNRAARCGSRSASFWIIQLVMLTGRSGLAASVRFQGAP